MDAKVLRAKCEDAWIADGLEEEQGEEAAHGTVPCQLRDKETEQGTAESIERKEQGWVNEVQDHHANESERMGSAQCPESGADYGTYLPTVKVIWQKENSWLALDWSIPTPWSTRKFTAKEATPTCAPLHRRLNLERSVHRPERTYT